LCKHWRHLLPWAETLSREQKREYGLGWLNWLGADSVGVIVALLNIVWVPVVAFANIAVPDRILTLPILAAFIVSIAHFATLYSLRVRVPLGQMLGAVCAAMSMQWTVAQAVGTGVLKERLPFLRTAKGGATRKGDFPAFWEAVIAALLLVGSLTLVVTNYKQVHEINIFAACSWCRAYRSSPRWRSRSSRERALTPSPTGAASRSGCSNCCPDPRRSPKRRSFPPRNASKLRSKNDYDRSSPRRRGPSLALIAGFPLSRE